MTRSLDTHRLTAWGIFAYPFFCFRFLSVLSKKILLLVFAVYFVCDTFGKVFKIKILQQAQFA